MMLRFKWDSHAELRTGDIEDYLAGLPNIRFHVIDIDRNISNDDDRGRAKTTQIISILQRAYE